MIDVYCEVVKGEEKMKDKEKQAGWWGISVGICILKSCGVKRTKLKKSLMDIVDYLYLDKEMEK